MVFLNPWALLGMLVIGVVVWLHMRRPRKTLQVSNIHLWQAADEALSRKRPVLERIRKNWLLILQILFCLCIILALARPSLLFWSKSQIYILVFDCSASMNARERNGTRIEIAKEESARILDKISSSDRVLIVQAQTEPVLNRYFGSEKRSIRKALQSLSATEQSSNLAQALGIGISSIEKAEPYEAFVFSDGTEKFSTPANANNVHFIQTGDSENNVALSRLSIRSNPFSPYDREIFIQTANFSNHSQEFRLTLSLGQYFLLNERIQLGNKEQKSFAIPAPVNGSGIVKAQIDITDDLADDNQAIAALDFKKMSVLLVTAGNAYLEAALRVNPKVALTIMQPDEYARSDPKGYGVIILDGVAAKISHANYLIIEPPARNPVAIGKGLISPRPGHPVISHVSLGNIAIEEAWPLKIQPSETVLIEKKGEPLMASSENGGYRALRMGFDIRSSNLPLTVSFPVLLSNAIDWLGSQPDESIYVFSEQESDIKPKYKPAAQDAASSNKAITRAGREIWRLLLIIAIALLLLIWSFDHRSRKSVKSV
jgi:hypothetical protein